QVPIKLSGGLSVEDLIQFYCNSKIGLNLSVNDNDTEKKTQMKQRVFELAAANAVILTEDHKALHHYFKDGEEMVTFRTVDEFRDKANWLLDNPGKAEDIARAGHERFLKEYESKVVLSSVLEAIT
ncbi:MAG: glycosyltransferase, partial [Candidatus Thorarchaeota archaeon]